MVSADISLFICYYKYCYCLFLHQIFFSCIDPDSIGAFISPYIVYGGMTNKVIESLSVIVCSAPPCAEIWDYMEI